MHLNIQISILKSVFARWRHDQHCHLFNSSFA